MTSSRRRDKCYYKLLYDRPSQFAGYCRSRGDTLQFTPLSSYCRQMDIERLDSIPHKKYFNRVDRNYRVIPTCKTYTDEFAKELLLLYSILAKHAYPNFSQTINSFKLLFFGYQFRYIITLTLKKTPVE